MIEEIVKAPGEAVTHRAVFHVLSVESGERINGDLGWLIKLIRGKSASLRVTFQDVGHRHSEAVLEGGQSGDVYQVTSEVETTANKRLKLSHIIKIVPAAH